MDESFRKQADEWFDRATEDIEVAQRLFDDRSYSSHIAFNIHQAVEKYLKGLLVLHGKQPPRIHELNTLLSHVNLVLTGLEDFLEFCEKVSHYYMKSRYPPGPLMQYKYEDLEEDLDNALELIDRIHKELDK